MCLSYEPLEIKEDLTYEDKPFRIIEHKEQDLYYKKVQLFKVQHVKACEKIIL